MVAGDTTLRQWLRQKPFTLSMSSGFFGFFAHCGMASVLEEEQLVPARITGSSAGALVGGCMAAGCRITDLQAVLFALGKDDFWDPGLGLGLLRGKLFRKLIADLLPVDRIEACPIPLTLSVFEVPSLRTRAWNDGDLVDAIYASCAVPLMFQPLTLKRRLYWDGGVRDRHGLEGVATGERVFYHHLASRSPWRGKNSAALKVPVRPELAALVIDGLVRSGPDRLEQGRMAFHQARVATLDALDKPLIHQQVRITAQSVATCEPVGWGLDALSLLTDGDKKFLIFLLCSASIRATILGGIERKETSMASLNKVTLIGRLGKDPEVRYTRDQVPFARFSLATSDSFVSNGEKREKTEWHNIVVWRKQAEIAGRYLKKGKMIYVEGKIEYRDYEDQNGQRRYITDIRADRFLMLSPAGEGGGGYAPNPEYGGQQGGGYGGNQGGGGYGGNQGGGNQGGGGYGGNQGYAPAPPPQQGGGGYNPPPAQGQGGGEPMSYGSNMTNADVPESDEFNDDDIPF